jgi:hypothetical protein
MSHHARRSLRTPLLVLLPVIGLNLAAAVIWAAYRLLPLLLLAGLAWCGWRLATRRRILPAPGPAKVLPAGVMPDRTAELEAEVDDLRRQVAKLEDDAARSEEIVEELERAAGRPIEVILASYRKIAGFYGAGARP